VVEKSYLQLFVHRLELEVTLFAFDIPAMRSLAIESIGCSQQSMKQITSL